MELTNKMRKWMQVTLVFIGVINLTGIMIGIYRDEVLTTLVFAFNAVIIGLIYNIVSKIK